MAIPKIIHYCWLSTNNWDPIHHRCFDSWKRLLPNYKFVLWEATSEACKVPFVKKMIKQKSWAFASDYIRLYAIYNYGGIYLDLDVRVLKSFDKMLKHTCFLGREDKDYLACHVFGAEKENDLIKECLDFYDTSFRLKIGQPPTMPRIVTKIALRRGLTMEDSEIQKIAHNALIYPSIYFSPLHYSNRHANNVEQYISSEAYCIHYWHHGWSWLNSRSIYKYIVRQPWLFMNKKDFKWFLVHLFRLIKDNFIVRLK